MSKPNPYCECHKWDQPGGICAYCVGYTDGWTTETAALRRERDALRDRLEAMRRGLDDVKDATRGEDYGSDCGSEDANRAWDIARLALEADDEASRAAGKGAG